MADHEDERWAPWYLYLVPIVGGNFLKQQFMAGVPVAVNVAVTVALVTVLVVGITWAWRNSRRRRTDRTPGRR